ncbi:unnamed protein product [Rhodiola kirilowii]
MARKRSRSERERDKIASRRCVTNRYIDVPTLERIGLHDQVVEILHSCGWTGLLEMRDVTYPDLVREFISEFEFLDEDEDQEGMFRFKVRNLEIEMTLGDVRELFGWPAEGQAGTPPLEDAVLAWKEITGGEVAFDPGRTVESGMRRELYCYLHRVISCTIYGRENGQEKVSQIDHDLLYYLHRQVPVDFARLLGSRLQEIRYMDGPLMCGGFVTRIVSSIAGFDIERNYRGRLELKLIDMGMLTRMRVIQVDEVTDTVAWIHFKEPTVSPPAPPVEHQQITPLEAVNLQNAFEQSSLAIKELSRDLDQMKKKLKSDMYRMEMNMYDLFQTVSPGWKPPFPPSPPSPVPEEYHIADDDAEGSGI